MLIGGSEEIRDESSTTGQTLTIKFSSATDLCLCYISSFFFLFFFFVFLPGLAGLYNTVGKATSRDPGCGRGVGSRVIERVCVRVCESESERE
ncbi:hypothetical protein LX32DRAFT_51833 [Colletotrichum zoysiae]|uniref:Uncharacterized protein n=1 Tax=Colletotrichum zoysiae TaxID=1216348 RepID=A0AAD9M1G8_9PEZI|nr:hypothetical protein LX32DRAFT_51833 [Colletotrichum zoysiae]